MRAFIEVSGPAAHLPLDNIDTDTIIRIEHITSPDPERLGHYALQALRLRADGSENPDFVLNQPAFRQAPFLLAGRNFGCGSSRETAVAALYSRGIRCVIAPSFGDIFHNNCYQNGLLPIVLDADVIAGIAAQCAEGQALAVDLRDERITLPDGSQRAFRIEAMRREALLAGLDEIALTLSGDALTREWQARDRIERPWVWV
jgi:3-isopropylmalate/(R)-2-methylmalate dehydratase small subunit